MILYHNPRCRKSRETLILLEEKGVSVDIKEYLKDVPTQKELKEIISILGIKPKDLIRTSESIYKEKYKGKDLSDAQWIKAMVSYPKLIQRPILINKGKAALGRPPEAVLTII